MTDLFTKQSLKERFKAFGIHLIISLIILAVLLYVLIYIWYPPPFFTADGGWQGLKIIIGVDLVLGPLLTLMIYNPGKGLSRLKMDLVIIGFVQVFALIAGSYVVYDQRTRMVVFANNRFVSLTEEQIRESSVPAHILPTLKSQNPPMAFVGLPEDPAQRQAAISSNLGGQLLFKRGDLFQPLTPENRQKIVAEGYDLSDVASSVPEEREIIDAFLQKHGRPSADFSALPLYCRYAELALVMDRSSGELVDTINISHGTLIASLAAKRTDNQ